MMKNKKRKMMVVMRDDYSVDSVVMELRFSFFLQVQ
jgi:hypothetical protein